MIKQRLKKWWLMILALLAVIVGMLVYPYMTEDINVSATVWYSMPVLAAFGIFSALKWG